MKPSKAFTKKTQHASIYVTRFWWWLHLRIYVLLPQDKNGDLRVTPLRTLLLKLHVQLCSRSSYQFFFFLLLLHSNTDLLSSCVSFCGFWALMRKELDLEFFNHSVCVLTAEFNFIQDFILMIKSRGWITGFSLLWKIWRRNCEISSVHVYLFRY